MDHKPASLELFPRLNQYEVLINKNVLITEPDIRALIIFQYTNSVFLFSSIFKVTIDMNQNIKWIFLFCCQSSTCLYQCTYILQIQLQDNHKLKIGMIIIPQKWYSNSRYSLIVSSVVRRFLKLAGEGHLKPLHVSPTHTLLQINHYRTSRSFNANYYCQCLPGKHSNRQTDKYFVESLVTIFPPQPSPTRPNK